MRESQSAEDGRITEVNRAQVRGSTLLLVGRGLSLLINLAAQVLIVRHLSVSAYGAFAYALSLVMFGEMFTTLGLRRAIERYVPAYEERGDRDRVIGAIILATSVIFLLGIGLVAGILLARDQLSTVVDDELAVRVLLILIVLAPISALENLIDILFAVFAKAKAIFFRKYLVAPGLRLAIVLVLVLTAQDVLFLSSGYVVAGGLAVGFYAVLLVRTLRQRGLLQRPRRPRLPMREMFAFALPLLTTELVAVALHTADVVMLEYFRDTSEVAAIRAVVPMAQLNMVVMMSFGVLFMALASRLHSRGDSGAINGLHWQSASWSAVLSFPIFAVAFLLSDEIAVLLFGQEYAASGPLLAVMAVGYYVYAAAGGNDLVLNVFGLLRYVVVINLVVLLVNVGANLLLIPTFGALGAAIGTSATLILHAGLRQLGFLRIRGMTFLPGHYTAIFAAAGVWFLAVIAVRAALDLSVLARALIVLVSTVGVLAVARRRLDLLEIFPEASGSRLVRAIFPPPSP